MHAFSLDKHIQPWSTQFLTDNADARMVGSMRLLLAVSALLTVIIDPAGLGRIDGAIWPIFFAYALHCLIVYVLSRPGKPLAQSRLVHWLDVIWYGLIVVFTGAVNSFFFLFFFFAILTAAFRWGFDEGARVTIVSTVLFAACGLRFTGEDDLPRLLLRATFLLTLGYMSVHWGESKLELKRRLAVLHDVSRISNPRFGVDQTLASVLEKTRAFFGAGSCVLVVQDKDANTFSLRTLSERDAAHALKSLQIGADAAAPLLLPATEQLVVYSRILLHGRGRAHVCGAGADQWARQAGQPYEQLAELLNAPSFISAPLPLRKGSGRIYVISNTRSFVKADAQFLYHLGAQAFPVIENIELLDRMASEAALQERQKIARDLHDTAIQPYIGLKLGLSALRGQAAADNPLLVEINRLVAMAEKVIGDLRRYAGSVKNGLGQTEPMLLAALRQQTAQVKEFYGIDIAVEIQGEPSLSDRLTVEVLQLVREGLSNICKHTLAQQGSVRLRCASGWLTIEITNESAAAAVADFLPCSISERATALGGRIHVSRDAGGSTVVHIGIPV